MSRWYHSQPACSVAQDYISGIIGCYEERNKILDGKDLIEHVADVTYDTVEREVANYCSAETSPEDWDYEGLAKWVRDLTGRDDLPEGSDELESSEIVDRINDFVFGCYKSKEERLGDKIMGELSTQVMLRVIDTRWMSYLQE